MGTPDVLPLVVVGAGFSGTMVAIHLLRTLPPSRSVLLFERSGRFGRGLAYATQSHDHLLNVRAANMSALPDDPDHFSRWLHACGSRHTPLVNETPAGTFASRDLYGRYLADLVADAAACPGDGLRLVLEHDEVTDVAPTERGYAVHLASGRRIEAAGVVLACGNLRARHVRSRHAVDPWSTSPLGGLDAHAPLLIVGTGLTMVDAVISVRDRGFAGTILALSRRGLLPHAHASAPAWPTPRFSSDEGRSLLSLLVRLRSEIIAAARTGVGWRGVIDSLRPVSGALWRGLPRAERARFLRHLRAHWDVHRHRAAPAAAERVAGELTSGRLRVLAARVEAIRDGAGGAVVTVRERGSGSKRELKVAGIVDASGNGRVAETDDLLLRRLLARGEIVPDELGLGLGAARDFALADRRGAHDRPLWTLGPLLRGTLWECTAVPDIREQAADLARTIAAAMARPSPLHLEIVRAVGR